MTATVADVLRVAANEKGVVESPPNSNRVKYWAELDKALQGNPWCGAYVSWVFRKAGAPLPAIDKPYGFVYVPDAETWAKAHGRWRNAPQPGLVAIYGFGGSIGIHTGIVETVINATEFRAIEGNTSSTGGSNTNGGEVARRHRLLHDARGFIDFGLGSSPTPDPHPDPPPIHLGDNVTRVERRIPFGADGRGWSRLPGDASKVVGITVQGWDPLGDPAHNAPWPLPAVGATAHAGEVILTAEGGAPNGSLLVWVSLAD